MNKLLISPQCLKITLEDNAVLADVKRVLKMIKGVASVHVKTQDDSKLNVTTIKAIEDVKEGKTFSVSSVDDLLTQCLN